MKRTVLLYGGVMAVLIGLLKFVEYRFFVHDLSIEYYIGIIAVGFTALGIWAGKRITGPKIILAHPDFTIDQSTMERLGISKREYEVLDLIAQGFSNNEIAEKLFISPSTVKSHTSSLYLKLDARRRTEALRRARELRLIT